MKKIILFIIILLTSTTCSADTVQIDSVGWTQQQKNFSEVTALRVLDDAGITHKGVKVILPNIEIKEPSAPVNVILTKTSMEAEYTQWMGELEAARVAEQQKQDAMNAEYQANDMKKVTLSQIDSKIDSISNLAEAKAFLKKLTHYLWARGAFEQ